MTSTSRVTAAPRPRRATRGLALSFLALSLVLPACTPGEPTTEPTETEISVQPSAGTTDEPGASASPTTGATAGPTPGASTPPTAGGTPPSSPTASASDGADHALLTISIKQDASADPVQYVLECVDGVPGPASTLPGAQAACARIAALGPDFFTARPDKDIICTQQYAGPQTASITGDFNGTSVLASFALTDGCEISRWKQVQELLGAPGAQ
ncbi:hypothetical protein E8P82_11000 [Arthrobacter echini]|uniref:Serine protease inhibitor n=1 Tax=Arthrobacter echini TaxID=1529066 RepID=A0A4S5E309_9MICC|nr:SSI family serine proteinase inhibitor [Arthrobacter echini]THJ65805.1 hypothetical protein E8P82_11000 [Arthrobacter echini]